jgi:hypothetical protein
MTSRVRVLGQVDYLPLGVNLIKLEAFLRPINLERNGIKRGQVLKSGMEHLIIGPMIW